MSAEAPKSSAPGAYDVFNGDADGLCALHQLRLARPREAHWVTGVKRDVALLSRVPCEAGVDVTVLDVSLDANIDPLARLLDAGAHVAYFDHHSARRMFLHPRLQLEWDDSPDVCTSVIVDRTLGGRYRPWAIVGAFGDNLDATAHRLAMVQGLAEREVAWLRTLGQLLNYNAYGETIDDLHIRPDMLYRTLHEFVDPLEFVAISPCYRQLDEGYREDLARVDALAPYRTCDDGAVYVLPDEPWARRISGTFANRLAAECREKSFAVLSERGDGSHCVSVRSAKPDACPANVLCERFDGGGGRRGAAGVNALPAADLDRFVDAFSTYFKIAPAHAERVRCAGNSK
ncbi:DHHA1 domain-containing protein [Trinickia dinghuensis]|uniref:DHHA1 domain-containing protein n=1 Tax=Trinickia dinghuensis TaxID=2291023 RepID=A0A3D8JZR1_9BURK|nr:DHHA1 domain-containing protein [Trinickia dinghuensis]RDU98538.1 hypothetical protein DWV00_14720 [Trinickia dinghuensis]